MQWIHGGPFTSYNCWSWRWNPWVAVARGWAVLLPDPPLSTGYGHGWLERAWPYRARVVWHDVEALLDHVVARPDVDGSRTALLGASFGGYMTNWIAGHTDRFGAIVTHAGLWALDQQHVTTDAAQFKTVDLRHARRPPRVVRRELAAQQRRRDHDADARRRTATATTACRCRRRCGCGGTSSAAGTGDPADLPHRFLQFTGENHWVLSPANAEIWWDAVLGFCGRARPRRAVDAAVPCPESRPLRATRGGRRGPYSHQGGASDRGRPIAERLTRPRCTARNVITSVPARLAMCRFT